MQHRKDEFDSYLKGMNPISDIVLEKIKSHPALFQNPSQKDILSVVGLQNQVSIFSSENINLAKSVVNGVETVFSLLKK